MEVRDSQPSKALSQISVVYVGIVTVESALSPAKIRTGSLVILQLRVALMRAVQSVNALSPISVTELGIVIPTRDLQLAKASLPILLRVSGSVTFSSAE